MSDTSQGQGWWLASDGKWYPPETWTGPPQQGGPTPYPAQVSPYGGAPVPGSPVAQGPPYVLARQTNGMAVASLVCACGGIIPFFFGIPCILGIIFGFVARGQIKRTNGLQEGNGLALAGIIVGFSLIAIFIAAVTLAFAFGHVHTCTSNSSTYSCSMN